MITTMIKLLQNLANVS